VTTDGLTDKDDGNICRQLQNCAIRAKKIAETNVSADCDIMGLYSLVVRGQSHRVVYEEE